MKTFGLTIALSLIAAVAVAARYDDVARWANSDSDNLAQFVRDLRNSQDARSVARALAENAARQRRATSELVRLIHLHPELRNIPPLGIDTEGMLLWLRSHPASGVSGTVPAEITSIQDEMHRKNARFDSDGGVQPVDILRKYNRDPQVIAAAQELERVMITNRRDLLNALR